MVSPRPKPAAKKKPKWGKPEVAKAPEPERVGAYKFQIGPIPIAAGSRLKGAAK